MHRINNIWPCTMAIMLLVVGLLQGTTIALAKYGISYVILAWCCFGCLVLIHRQREYLSKLLYLTLVAASFIFCFNPLTVKYIASNLLAL
jgi:hypothetical protein